MTSADMTIKLFTLVTNSILYWAWLFATVKHFCPSPMFEVQAPMSVELFFLYDFCRQNYKTFYARNQFYVIVNLHLCHCQTFLP
jgi:hypothetical protein